LSSRRFAPVAAQPPASAPARCSSKGRALVTGTPGTTRAMQPGDIVEIEVQGVGVLRNTVAAEG
jgi:hypothetical protein